jgi:hypothetical protein
MRRAKLPGRYLKLPPRQCVHEIDATDTQRYCRRLASFDLLIHGTVLLFRMSKLLNLVNVDFAG